MFRKELPRIYELRDQIEAPNFPRPYFQNFDNSLGHIWEAILPHPSEAIALIFKDLDRQ